MSSVNKAILIGNLGKDPELKATSGGKDFCKFSVATTESWGSGSGNDKKEHTEWHNIVVWGAQAASCGRYLHKGSKVYVEGRIQTRSWQDDSGQTRYMTEINANKVVFLSPKEASPNRSGGYSPNVQNIDRARDRAIGSNCGGNDGDDIPF